MQQISSADNTIREGVWPKALKPETRRSKNNYCTSALGGIFLRRLCDCRHNLPQEHVPKRSQIAAGGAACHFVQQSRMDEVGTMSIPTSK